MKLTRSVIDFYKFARYLSLHVRLRHFKQSERITYAVNFSKWKRPFLEKMFPDRIFLYLSVAPNITLVKRLFDVLPPESVFIWGMRGRDIIAQIGNKKSVGIQYFEDGFIRSIGLGSSHVLPLSLCIDPKTVHYNCAEPSTLDEILSSYDFDVEILNTANNCIQNIVQYGISKYNIPSNYLINENFFKKDNFILCCGQVEDDESLIFGCDRQLNNNDLIRLAAIENPGIPIIYKAHPDYVAGNRKPLSNFADVAHLCTMVGDEVPLSKMFSKTQRVYTITSLSGFEALLHGIPVTTLGMPFYAGWGLTDDRQIVPSWRVRKLTLEQVFAGAYLLYPQYFKADATEKSDLPGTLLHIIERLEQVRG
jgi:capsular polysaccharide export protein